jgi:hypothetical protein
MLVLFFPFFKIHFSFLFLVLKQILSFFPFFKTNFFLLSPFSLYFFSSADSDFNIALDSLKPLSVLIVFSYSYSSFLSSFFVLNSFSYSYSFFSANSGFNLVFYTFLISNCFYSFILSFLFALFLRLTVVV